MVRGRGIKEISGQQGLQRNVRRLRSWVRGLKIWVRLGSESGHRWLNESRPDRTYGSVTQDLVLCRHSCYTSDTIFV